MNGAMYFKDAYGIPTKRYGKATLRIGKVVLNSHVRVTSISNTSPENIHITNIRKNSKRRLYIWINCEPLKQTFNTNKIFYQ
jgi:hypothetical protein